MRLNTGDVANVNPYHYVLHCLSGKWKMTLVHEIYACGRIRFNETLRTLPISEKVLSQQLQELCEDGIVMRKAYGTVPPMVEYYLTPNGERLIPAMDLLFIWAIRRMDEKCISIDKNAFSVHKSEKYVAALQDIMEDNGFWPEVHEEEQY